MGKKFFKLKDFLFFISFKGILFNKTFLIFIKKLKK